MALLWMDGFDWMDEYSDDVDIYNATRRRYNDCNPWNASPDATTVEGRHGIGRAIQFGAYGQWVKTPVIHLFESPSTTLIAGWALKPLNWNNQDECFFAYRGAQRCMLLRFDNTGLLQYYPNGDWFDPGINTNAWNYIEVKAEIQSSGGNVWIRVNGKQVYEKLNFDSCESSWGDGWSAVYLGSNREFVVDDFYVCDDSGDRNNDFLGDVRVLMHNPNSDHVTEWSQSGGGGFYEDIDDQPLPAGLTEEAWTDANYIESDTTGNKCLFNYENLPTEFSNQDILAVQLSTAVKVTVPQPLDLKTKVLSGKTETTLATRTTSNDTYELFDDIMELDANTGAPWTPAGYNAAKFGMEVG